jgi:hypothetical protein
VTVFDSASGAPTASTGSPTWIVSESANSTGGRPVWSIFRTATSDSVSVPTSRAGAVRPSEKVTVIEAPPLGPPTTWSLVSTYPSPDTMKPEPRLPELPARARIVTTLGRTFLTTPASDSGARLAASGGLPPRLEPPPSGVPPPPRSANT